MMDDNVHVANTFALADATAADNDELAALAEDLVKGEVPDAVAA